MSLYIEELTDPLALKMKEACHSSTYPPGSFRVQPSGCVVTSMYPQHAQRLRDFEVREDDIWVVSYPKCGTTWTQEMVWLLGSDLDYKKAKETTLNERVPFFEIMTIVSLPPNVSDDFLMGVLNDRMESPRFFKTHLPRDLLPTQLWTKKPKVIYVSRDPKDAAVSYYHHHRLWNDYKGTQEEFMDAFLGDVLVYSPFWEHVTDFWAIRDKPNVLFNTYEEMKKDLPSVIRKTSQFLGKSLTEDQVESLAGHLSFSSMKENPAVNNEHYAVNERKDDHDPNLKFIRQGEAGGWKKAMDPTLAAQFDRWTERKLQGTGYKIGVSS